MFLTSVAQWVGHHPANQSLLVQFPIGAHTWVVSQVPGWGCERGTNRCFSHNPGKEFGHLLTKLNKQLWLI